MGTNLESLCVCVITRYPVDCTLLRSSDCLNEYANRGERRRRGAKLLVLGFVTRVALMLTSVTLLVFYSLY